MSDAFTLDTSGVVLIPRGKNGLLAPTRVKWSGLDAFTQGYIEALFAESAGLYWAGAKLGARMTRGFSDLAPETLALIIADCAATTASRTDLPLEWGGNFWRNRQAGEINAFPPLTPYLGDDGKVCLRAEVAA